MKKTHLLPRVLRLLNPWWFIALAVLSGIVAITALRANNIHMGQLRDAVFAADKNDGDVKTALQNLQAYVTTHMNTGLASGPNAVYPPIQLKYTHDRLEKEETDRVAQVNARLYPDAERYCEAKIPTGFSGLYRISCIQDYVKSHGAQVQAIPDSLYEFDFKAPLWSPDLAGWSVLATALLLLVAVVVGAVCLVWRRT